jgi:hypothetical protein
MAATSRGNSDMAGLTGSAWCVRFDAARAGDLGHRGWGWLSPRREKVD